MTNSQSAHDKIRQIGTLLIELADALATGQPTEATVEIKHRTNLERTDELANLRRRWTLEDEQLLMDLHNRGVSRKDMAKVLGRTPKAIKEKLHHPESGMLKIQRAI